MGVTTNLINKPYNPRGNDQSPLAYNRAALYSGKALSFDGVNDYVDLDGFTMAGDKGTFCFYADVDNDAYVFDMSPNRLVFLHNETSGQGIRVFNSTGWSNYGLVDRVGVLFYTIVCDGTSQSVFVNGQQVGDTQTIGSALNISSATKVKLGSNYINTGTYLNGQIAGFKIFNTALTAAQIADLYNFPEKIVPTGVDNTALKLWLPMMEGAGTYCINGAPDALGSEEVTNGDFATDSDWTLNSNWLVSGGTANADGTSSNPMFQDGVVGSGKSYIVTYTLSNFTQGSVYVDLGSGGIGATRTSAGTYTETIVAGSSNTRFYLRGSGNFIVSIDNVSVKETSGFGTISGATWTHGIGAPVAQTAVINWNKVSDGTNSVLIPQGLTTGRDLLGNLFENVRKQGALNLDGNSWAEVHDNASLDFGTGSFTLEAWVIKNYVNSGSSLNIIMSLGNNITGANNTGLTVNSTNVAFKYTQYHGHNVTTGDWVHVVGVYDETNVILYVDGVAETTTARTAINVTNALTKYIGRDSTTLRYYSDQIAQPRIYNRALTNEEVQRNYNAGKNIYS
mgnify:CR=1 FL=1